MLAILSCDADVRLSLRVKRGIGTLGSEDNVHQQEEHEGESTPAGLCVPSAAPGAHEQEGQGGRGNQAADAASPGRRSSPASPNTSASRVNERDRRDACTSPGGRPRADTHGDAAATMSPRRGDSSRRESSAASLGVTRSGGIEGAGGECEGDEDDEDGGVDARVEACVSSMSSPLLGHGDRAGGCCSTSSVVWEPQRQRGGGAHGAAAKRGGGDATLTVPGAVWNEELTLDGIKVRDLPLDAVLEVTLVYTERVAHGHGASNEDEEHPRPSSPPPPPSQCRRGRTRTVRETAVLPLFTRRGRRMRSGEYRLELRRDSLGRFDELARVERVHRRCRRGVVATGSAWLEGRMAELVDDMREAEREQTDGVVLVVELPSFEHPIIFQDAVEGGAAAAAAAAAAAVDDPTDAVQPEGGEAPVYYSRRYQNRFEDPEDGFSLSGMSGVHNGEVPGPAELKARKLARSVMADPRSKPDGEEREKIAEILRQPPASAMTAAEQQLLWRFRNTLTADPKALSKFLRAVDWEDAGEANQAADLAERWAPMQTSAALELLGPFFSNQRIRQLAVSVLSGMDDEELRCYLLQLVAALRYEESVASSPLAEMLVRRATQSPTIACYLHWYLLVECDDPVHGFKFDSVHERFVDAQRSSTKDVISGEIVLEGIRHTSELMSQLCAIMRDLKNLRGGTAKKAERLRHLLSPSGPFGELSLLGNPGPPCPLNPRIRMNGIIPEQSGVFKSALHPLRLAFRTSEGEVYKAIFKKGDDLRQDQLVVQMIALMDRLLKRENLDLQLTPYAVIATGLSEGLVEFVPSIPLSQVLEKYRSIPRYLASANPDAEGPMKMKADVHETFVRSCAGSCVVTYVLGVGDRHLDNLMLTAEGKLFHIDFGYIMGRDPKPFAPPVKLCREMVEAMGGVDSAGYDRFRSYCCEAFNILRKSSNLILNLIMLMSEASIPDISVDPERTLLKLQEKLCLDANDEEASQFFQGVLNESATALFPNLVETAHRWAQYWR